MKIPTLGGAIAAYTSVDCYSDYMHGYLVKTVANAVEHVQTTHQQYTKDQHIIQTFAADGGVIIQNEYRVLIPDAQRYLLKHKIEVEVGEPYNHDHGNAYIERGNRSVKELILFATLYILNNPNFNLLGFTQHEIFTLWGELFNWAITINNLKICPNDPTQTKYEVYHKRKPDLREIRILPIFSVLYVLRKSNTNKPVPTNKHYWKRGLYTGPSIIIPGSIRVAIKTKKRIKIVTTSIFKGVSDGGGINVYNINPQSTTINAIPLKNQEIVDEVEHNDQLTNTELDDNISAEEHQSQTADTPVLNDSTKADTLEESADVGAILAHKGKPKKRTKMQFQVRWKGYDPSHDQWLPWSELKNIWVLHNYLRDNQLGHLIPRCFQLPNESTEQRNDSVDQSQIVSAESRGDEHEIEHKNEQQETNVENDTNVSNPYTHAADRDKTKMLKQVLQWGTREERMKRRQETISSFLAELNEQSKTYTKEVSYFVDWSRHTDESIYFSFSLNAYICIEQDQTYDIDPTEEGYRAVTQGVPNGFNAAMVDQKWGDAARTEFETITTATGTLVEVNKQIADENIRNGAQVLRLLAVYEEKVRDGVTVEKVRLVADGRTHHIHGPTYSSTPNREECMILLHVFAAKDWDYYVMDEKRAFLSAPRQDTRPMYAKISGIQKIFEVKKALYGTKDACRDYRVNVEKLYIDTLGCEKLQLCSCIFVKRISDELVLILSHVDDYLFGGSKTELTMQLIEEARQHASYTDPELNASKFLGLELSRDRVRKIIKITMTAKIQELADKYNHAVRKKRNVPMPINGYIVRDHEIEAMSDKKKRMLTQDEITVYMAIVGSLIWIQGVRLDIIFAVLYLSWFTKCPRQHHMDMAEYVIGYLYTTKDMPLVLGGEDTIQPIVDADASHGTGPNSRSISGELTRLNEKSGAISAKAKAQTSVKLSSFESELDNTTTNIKTARRVSNILDELTIPRKQARVRQDNEAMINFVKGNSMVKGARHMELRMYYTREEYQKGHVQMEHQSGKLLTADKLTKLGNVTEHRQFAADIQGLQLLGYNYFIEDEITPQSED